MHFYQFGIGYQEGSGGIIGAEITNLLIPVFSYVGATLFMLATFLFGLTAFLDISWIKVMEQIGRFAMSALGAIQYQAHRMVASWKEKSEIKKSAEHRREALEKHVEKKQQRAAPVIEALPKLKPQESKRASKERQGNLFRVAAVDGLPALHLLDDNTSDQKRGYSPDDLEAMSRLLELKLKDYGVEAEVVAVSQAL